MSPDTPTRDRPNHGNHLAVGLRSIQAMDGLFDATHFLHTASDFFFKVQDAWTARHMRSVRDILTPDMYDALQRECDRLVVQRRVGQREQVAIRSMHITEARQEGGEDFVTVRFLVTMIDYTVDEASEVTAGSRTEPVRVEECWTFARPLGPNPWRLSAMRPGE